MKKGRILNKNLNTAIANMAHTDIMIIADAAFPIPSEAQRIDLAICQDVPGVAHILELVMSDLIYERVIVAEEQKLYNQPHYNCVCALSERYSVETIPHAELMETISKQAKYIVRTGAFEPWGNVVLVSGIDAPEWFKKPGVTTPDYYAERAAYREE